MRRMVGALLGLAVLAAACTGPSAISAPRPLVSKTSGTANTAAVSVRASDYRVLVLATGPSWVASSYPSPIAGPSEMPGTIQADQSRSYSPIHGKLSLEVGSSEVKVEVQVHGRAVPGGRLFPQGVPYTLNFSSVS